MCGLLFTGLVQQLNHSLGPWGFSLWISGLLIAFPALRLAPQQGFNACFILGLVVDASTPLPFGLNAFLFAISHLVIVRIRGRFASSEALLGTVVALINNLVLYVIVTFIVISRAPDAPFSGLRLLTDLIASQLFIAIVAPWFFAVQENCLRFARVDLHDSPSAMT